MSTKFKIGDKVKRVAGSYGGMVVGDVGTVVEVDMSGCFEVVRLSEFGDLLHLAENLVSHQAGQFTKSDLKDGMRVVYREGNERLVIGDTLYCYEKINLSFGFAAMLQDFSDTLEFKDGKFCDIMKVVDRDGTVLFERDEAPAKSQQEIEMDKLQKQIAELSAQADKLKASMK